ncbi:glucan biosynthesis protein, partial [Salmonella enterica subsp. enterica serovar Montevideo]|nr:glucan biosynthesis protein [Salmonella enterica subsp. enterica serovar Montevideo]
LNASLRLHTRPINVVVFNVPSGDLKSQGELISGQVSCLDAFRPVKINEVTATTVKRIKYSPDYFNFGNVQHDKDTVKDLGFAGF